MGEFLGSFVDVLTGVGFGLKFGTHDAVVQLVGRVELLLSAGSLNETVLSG